MALALLDYNRLTIYKVVYLLFSMNMCIMNIRRDIWNRVRHLLHNRKNLVLNTFHFSFLHHSYPQDSTFFRIDCRSCLSISL